MVPTFARYSARYTCIGVTVLAVCGLTSCDNKPKRSPDNPYARKGGDNYRGQNFRPRARIDRDKDGRPIAPYKIEEPSLKSPAELNGKKLSSLEFKELHQLASKLAKAKQYQDAITVQKWAVQIGDGRGQYNLCCYYSRAGETDNAAYWFQRAALEEGVYIDTVRSDADLRNLRQTSRWRLLRSFLHAVNGYFARQYELQSERFIKPKEYKGKHIPVVIVMPRMPADMELHFQEDRFRKLADKLRILFVGAGPTSPIGPYWSVWSGSQPQDLIRIRSLAKKASRRVRMKGKPILLGQGYGGHLAGEIAAARPQEYAGAILLAPLRDNQGMRVPHRSHLIRDRRFVVVADPKDASSFDQAKEDYKWLRDAGAKVRLESVEFPKGGIGIPPPLFQKKIPEWIKFIEDASAQQDRGTTPR